ncbi:hypothetical protein Tco_0154351 [Tanacetum coccineum]
MCRGYIFLPERGLLATGLDMRSGETHMLLYGGTLEKICLGLALCDACLVVDVDMAVVCHVDVCLGLVCELVKVVCVVRIVVDMVVVMGGCGMRFWPPTDYGFSTTDQDWRFAGCRSQTTGTTCRGTDPAENIADLDGSTTESADTC